MSSHSATVTDGVLKLCYTSVAFVDLRVKVIRTSYCDLLLSQQSLPCIPHVAILNILEKKCPSI